MRELGNRILGFRGALTIVGEVQSNCQPGATKDVRCVDKKRNLVDPIREEKRSPFCRLRYQRPSSNSFREETSAVRSRKPPYEPV